MAKNTSILLGEYFENFVKNEVASGKFSSVSEVVRAALRLFENEEKKYQVLITELELGEQSGFVNDFDRNETLKSLRAKYLQNEL